MHSMRRERAVRPGARMTFATLCALLLAPLGSAHAYCRTTTCDVELEDCQLDEHGCATLGLPLYWQDACVTVWVPSEPALPGVAAGTLETLTQDAFATWREVSCEDGAPAVDVLVAGSECIAPSNDDDGAPDRVNVIRTVTEDWPHAGGFLQIALTTIGFVPSSGEIKAFEIELNAADHRFTTSDRAIEVDLLSTLTHEAGHALGLAHSDVSSATMFTHTGSTTRLRTLEPDDEAAICDLYPPAPGDICGDVSRADPEAVCAEINARASALTHRRRVPGGGCTIQAGTARTTTAPALIALVLALLVRVRRRRK